MRLLKKAGIWLAAMLVIVLAVNTAGGLILKLVLGNTLIYSTMGYSQKCEKMLHPVRNENAAPDENNGLAVLNVRAVMSNNRFLNELGLLSNFLFLNNKVDESWIYLDAHGMEPRSTGIFEVVYEDHGGNADYIRNVVGIVDVEELITLDYAPQVYAVLEKDPGAAVRLDAYTMEDFMIHPVSITILDGGGTELLHAECDCDGEIIEARNCFFQNDYDENDYDFNSLYHKMNTAYLGERASDKTARALADKVDFSRGDYEQNGWSIGLASVTIRHLEVHGDYAQITVYRLTYGRGVLLYTILLGTAATVILAVVARKRRYI